MAVLRVGLDAPPHAEGTPVKLANDVLLTFGSIAAVTAVALTIRVTFRRSKHPGDPS